MNSRFKSEPEVSSEEPSNRPKYQFELSYRTDYEIDDYKNMAKSSNNFFITQNWNSASEVETFEEINREPKLMPGYQAFYHLFIAGALPAQFHRDDFLSLFSDDNIKQKPQRWLIEKALTTPQFIS